MKKNRFATVYRWVALTALSSFSTITQSNSEPFLLQATEILSDKPLKQPVTRISITARIQVNSEDGQPVAAANIDLGQKRPIKTNRSGAANLALPQGATLAVVSAPGYLSEPLVIGHQDDKQTIQVKLWRSNNGKRFAVHSSGDVMFGRRYNAPVSGLPLIPEQAANQGGIAVVDPVRRAFASADFSTINLETVMSRLPNTAAYPGKRFLLNSWPETLAGVKALGTDLAFLANNHARDYLESGLEATLQALAQNHIPYQGATAGNDAGDTPAIMSIGQYRIGAFAWTSVDGSFVNDNYPSDTTAIPANLKETEKWQYGKRRWGFSGTSWQVPVAERRIG